MKKHYSVATVTAACIALSLSSCFDNDYDLSNIDSTVEVKVVDLVLPVNLKPVTLESVIDLDPDDDIKEIDGEYVLLQDGDFHSEEIVIDGFTIEAPAGSRTDANVPAIPGVSKMPIPEVTYDFKYKFDDVDAYIEDIERADVDMTITISVTSSVNATQYTDLEFHLPRGLYGTCNVGSYDPATGVAKIPTMNTSNFNFVLDVDYIVIADSEAKYNHDTRSFDFEDMVGLMGGEISVPQPMAVDLTIAFSFSELTVKTVTGWVYYEVDGLNVDPVSLSDLPDELRDPETELRLANPQIYITLENPLAQYGDVTASTGVSFTQVRNGRDGFTGVMPEKFTILGVSGEQTFCLSPVKPAKYYMGGNVTHNAFPDLSDLVYGAGLPDELKFVFSDPRMNRSHVTGLPLNHNVGTITGNYTLYAPLALGGGSKIVYSDEQTGWAGDVDDDLSITELRIEADVKSTLPVEVRLTAVPIDENGNAIPNVTINEAIVGANSTTHLVIVAQGTINDLDGVRYVATVVADDSERPLRTTESLDLTNIKAKVSGSYTTTL